MTSVANKQVFNCDCGRTQHSSAGEPHRALHGHGVIRGCDCAAGKEILRM